MEFLRFGSSIPGSYWGCCAMCIIQDFKHDPKAKASIQLVSGDGANPITNGNCEQLFAGPTYEDIFWQRLRYGTFDKRDMPNHGFLAILTENQLTSTYGKAWLAILKQAGFEFIRSVDNSVYSGVMTIEDSADDSSDCDCYCEYEDDCECDEEESEYGVSINKNYLFGLFRNIGRSFVDNPFTPPTAWTDLPSVVPEAWSLLLEKSHDLADEQRQAQLSLFNSLPKNTFFTEAELIALDVPITLSGVRSEYPQELKSLREVKQEKNNKEKSKASPWSNVVAA